MTACSSKIQSFCFKDETDFAEDVDTMALAQIIPGTVMIDLSALGPDFIDPGRIAQYKNERFAMIEGPHAACEIPFEFEWSGHGATMAGSPTLSAQELLIGWFLGGTVAFTASASTTIDGSGSTVTSLTTVSSGQHTPGGLIRVGTKGDGGGDGQWAVVDTCTTVTLALETALPAAPAAGAVVYGAANMFTLESTCGTGTSKRFRISTADTSWVLHGCTPKSLVLSGTNPGEIRKVSGVICVAWPEPVNVSVPDTSSTAPWTTAATPNAGGGCFLQVYGTTTRQIVTARAWSISISLGTQRLLSYESRDPNGRQIYGGASRTPDTIEVSIVVDAEGASATPTWWTRAGTNAAWHCLMGLTVGNGAACAIYLPNMRWVKKKPTQIAHEDLNRVQLDFVAGTDTAETSSELSLSAMRWGSA